HSHVELQTKTHQTDQHDNVQQNGREKNAEHMTINRSGDLSKTISPGLEINDQLGEIENDPNNTAMEIESNATIEETNELQDDLPKKKSYIEIVKSRIRNQKNQTGIQTFDEKACTYDKIIKAFENIELLNELAKHKKSTAPVHYSIPEAIYTKLTHRDTAFFRSFTCHVPSQPQHQRELYIPQPEEENRNQLPKGREIRASDKEDLLPLPDLPELIPEEIQQILPFELPIVDWRDTGQVAKELRVIFTFEKLSEAIQKVVAEWTQQATNKNFSTIILGDFNHDVRKYGKQGLPSSGR
ncbi:13578_t:CDS:2, partial [Gigaspora rosea]